MASPRTYTLSQCAEDPDVYFPGGQHPVHIGDTFKDGRYRVVHKLGYGSWSTVWLARDQSKSRYVAIKIEEANAPAESHELAILRHITKTERVHKGRRYVTTLLDDFQHDGPNGTHRCYVTEVGGRRLTHDKSQDSSPLIWSRDTAHQIAQAIQYLHVCGVGHGDLYPSNILHQIGIFNDWSEDEIYKCIGQPHTEKVSRADGQPVGQSAPSYTVATPDLERLEEQLPTDKILIVDFGQAFFHGDHLEDLVTPAVFTAPEILFHGTISEAADIWSLGCTIFEVFAGYSLVKMLFAPSTDARKDLVSLLGKPPQAYWETWKERGAYFDESGCPKQDIGHKLPVRLYPLEDRISDIAYSLPLQTDAHSTAVTLGQLKDLLTSMLRYEPADRLSLDKVVAHELFRTL